MIGSDQNKLCCCHLEKTNFSVPAEFVWNLKPDNINNCCETLFLVVSWQLEPSGQAAHWKVKVLNWVVMGLQAIHVVTSGLWCQTSWGGLGSWSLSSNWGRHAARRDLNTINTAQTEQLSSPWGRDGEKLFPLHFKYNFKWHWKLHQNTYY